MPARRMLSVLVLLVLPACGEGPRAEGGRESAFAPPERGTVAGRNLESVEDGGWTLRRVARSGPGNSGRPAADGDAAVLRRELASGDLDEGGDAWAGPGEAVPAGHREPTDGAPPPVSTPPAPTAGAPVRSPAPAIVDAAEGRRVRGGGGRPAMPQGQPSLKAGATDDNLDFEAYVEFLATWSDQVGVADRYRPMDVSDRRHLRVLDGAGRPVPGAAVWVVDESKDKVIWSGRTYGDGRLPFYPRVAAGLFGLGEAAPEGGWLVEARHGKASTMVRWDGDDAELVLSLDAASAVKEPIELDVGILLDTTGSMGDEIARIKATLLEITNRLRGMDREFDLRYGGVLYRDLGDAYVTMTHPFTEDIEAFAKALQQVEAQGGGDGPESLNQGLVEATTTLTWRAHAAKVLFVIADAPPHMDYEGDVPYDASALAALDRGIRVHTVAASGLDPFGTLVFRQVAQLTRGKFIFIEYGSTAQSAASHGVKGKVKSNNLDDILFGEIQNELDGWGRPDPEPGDATLPASMPAPTDVR